MRNPSPLEMLMLPPSLIGLCRPLETSEIGLLLDVEKGLFAGLTAWTVPPHQESPANGEQIYAANDDHKIGKPVDAH